MTKEQILNEWKPGDDSEAVRIIKERHGINLGRQAIAAWRKRKANRTPLEPIYIAAYEEAIYNRKKKNP